MKDQGQDYSWKCKPCASASKIIEQRLTNPEKTVSKFWKLLLQMWRVLQTTPTRLTRQLSIQIGNIQESVNQLKSSGNENAAKAIIAEQIEQNFKKLNVKSFS